MPHRALTLTLLAALTLSGCAASLAAGAIGAAARSAQGDPNAYYNNEALKLAAAQACRARAAPQGEVHVIDLEQRSARRVVVWGTATNASARQSFECTYTDRCHRLPPAPPRPLSGQACNVGHRLLHKPKRSAAALFLKAGLRTENGGKPT
jgi:hypothetical protein